VDPIFLCELALELKMPVGELGARMSAHELTVMWPAYLAWREEAKERERMRDELHSGRAMGSG
jgi:hypothetical protein